MTRSFPGKTMSQITDARCTAGLAASIGQSVRHSTPKGLLSGIRRSFLTLLLPRSGSLPVLAGQQCLRCRAASATEVEKGEAQQIKDAPKPIVKIDNQHDPFATVVSIQYGNKLGELLDTVCFTASRLSLLLPLVISWFPLLTAVLYGTRCLCKRAIQTSCNLLVSQMAGETDSSHDLLS